MLQRRRWTAVSSPAVLGDAFVNGTAVGGARPKVLLRDGQHQWIAKLSTSSDTYSVVKAEAVAMALARRVGISVPATKVIRSLGRDVLLVERFDRPGGGRRRMMLSALTMLGFDDFLGARYSSYVEVLDVLRRWGRDGDKAGRALFERIVFNVAISNIDDHARNHAAFWDGSELELTPAYDLCPQLRSGTEARQAMDITADGRRASQFALLVEAAPEYGLTRHAGARHHRLAGRDDPGTVGGRCRRSPLDPGRPQLPLGSSDLEPVRLRGVRLQLKVALGRPT